jgi:hypothetical protein
VSGFLLLKIRGNGMKKPWKNQSQKAKQNKKRLIQKKRWQRDGHYFDDPSKIKQPVPNSP